MQKPSLGYADDQVDVQQGPSQWAGSSFGTGALITPSLANPTQLTLMAIAEVWGHRRELWKRQIGVIAGWQVYPVYGPLCGLHFTYDGPAFEVLFAGNGMGITLIADGQYLSRRYINTDLKNGVKGAALLNPNCMVRFDLGSAKSRRLSLYPLSSQGPCAIAIPPGYRIQGWDRSAEASFCVMADSYGQVGAPNWGQGGPYWEAAAMLGIPHLDASAVGGTGYAPNPALPDVGDPSRTFKGRLPSVVAPSPDLFLSAGGINDNNWFASPPQYATAADAKVGFATAVEAYFRTLRAALPNSVLAAVGPWTPPKDPSPASAVQDKTDTIKRALQTIAGAPWIFLDNVNGSWSNSSGAASTPTGQRWLTGRGYEGAPVNDGGNSNVYISADGTHPNEAGCVYLAQQIATNLRAAILAM